MRLLLDENAPTQWLHLLSELGHHAEHVTDRGLRGKSDEEVLAFALAERFTLLTLNKFKRDPDRRDALIAMATGSRIIRVTAKGIHRQAQALTRCIGQVEESFVRDPALRRATIMNDFRVSYDSVTDIQRRLERDI